MPQTAADVMFGLYVIPPPHVVATLSSAHAVLEREFGATVAGTFMVHITVKGFFRAKPAADLSTLLAALDDAYANRPPFSLTLQPPAIFRHPLGNGVPLLVEHSEPLAELQRVTWQVLEPYFVDDWSYPVEPPVTNFRPHLTLMQYDLPSDPVLEEQAMELCRHLSAGVTSVPWSAQNLQFIRFSSQDWPGRWWETLSYQPLKGWRLG